MNRGAPARLVVVLVLVLASVANAALAAPTKPGKGEGPGRARITIDAPDGVPATVMLDGRTQRFAAKGVDGTRQVVVLDVESGAYRVRMPRVIADGRPYVGVATRPTLVVRPGATADLRVRYVAEPAARDVHATQITGTSVALTWEAPAGARVQIRRTEGALPARTRGKGVAVPVDGSTATDDGLTPGARYTYAVFTQHRGRWMGPTALTLVTAPPQTQPSDATYVAAPSTLIAAASDIVSVGVSGELLRVTLADHVPTPVPGAAIVLPNTPDIGGGIGVVAAISADGRTVDLEQGGLADAFDYYSLSIDDLSGPVQDDVAEVGAVTPTMAGHTAAAADQPMLAAADQPTLAAAEKKCMGTSSAKVSLAPKLRPGGYLKIDLDKYKALGVTVPKGVIIKAEVYIEVGGGATIDTAAGVTCEITLGEYELTYPSKPIDIAFTLQPGAKVSVDGKLKISNLGFKTKTGFGVDGYISFVGKHSFKTKRISERAWLSPKIETNGRVRIKLGVGIAVGPKVGIPKLGGKAGFGGEINPFDVQFKAAFPAPDPRFNECLEATASFSMAPYISYKLYLGSKFKLSAKVTFEALDKSWKYGTLYWPKNCQNLPLPKDEEEPDDSLLGDGVDKIDDAVTGDDGQWGYVDGFVPGKKTWVLSTGNVSDAIGPPSQFASTDLGRVGDAELTQLAGYDTFDAVTYTVTLVPAGDTLHVRYAFASEEYPEYVGSQFNDVMAVRVDGEQCAFVPGTTAAVSVNTVNHQTNSGYYVDNTEGAAGYGTSMDGLTTPLTCSVPVTPGAPVTVDIRLADGSDHIYDSAVALLDGGIWAD